MENQNALSNLIQQLSLSSQNLQNMVPPNVQHGAPPGFPPTQFPNYPPGHMNGAVNPNLYPPFPQVQYHQQPPMQFLPSQQPPVNFPSNPPPSFQMPHQRSAQGLIPPMSPSPIPATTESPPPSILSDLLGLQPSEPSPPTQIQIPTPLTPVPPVSVSPSPTLPRAELRASSESLKSPGGRKKAEEQPGIFLPPGSQIIHNIDPEALKKKTQALEVTPITLYSSLDYTYQPGTTIAVNRTYIGYIVRGDMIRVLNQKSASRGLLKGHTGIITDLSFFRDDVDLLLSCCKDGNIFIWNLSEQADGNISHELVFQIKGDKQVSVIRAVWHPLDETQFATAESDNSVKLWNRSACTANTIDRNSAQSISVVLPENENVQDLTFSPSGGELAVATVNTVKFYEVGVSTAPLLAQFQPHDQQISGITYVRASAEQTLFITGALRNSDIKLWSVDTKTNKFVCLQNVCLVCSASESYFWNHFSLDGTGSFLFIANTREKTIHVLHLKTGTDESRFDYITEFVVDQPILSFVVTNYERPGKIHIGPGQDMQLYCVQTKAIQSYHVNSDQCYTPSSNVNTPRDRQPEITQISIKNDIAPPLPQLTEEPVNLLAKLQLLANPQSAESTTHLTKTEQVSPPESEPKNSVSEKTLEPTLEPNVDVAITSIEEENNEEQESQTIPPENKKEEVAPANENTSFGESDESKTQTIGSPSTVANKTKSRTRKRKPETKDEIPPETVPANNQSSQAKNKTDSGKKITILSRPKQDGAISPPPAATSVEQPSSSTITTPETSGNNNVASLSNQQLLAAFSALQKRISASTENTMQTQMEKLYNRLETERKEREKQERERQEKLLAAVSQTINQNLANHLETIFKKEIQATVMPTLLKSVSQSMETTVLKLLQDNFKKLVVHVILPKLDAAIKDTLGKHNVQDTVASEINKQIELSINQSLERNMQHLLEVAISQSLDQPVRESFLNCFQGLLIPSFERSCQAMFLQLNDAFQSGLADRVQKQAYSTNIGNDTALTEQLKLAVSTLVETSTVMSKTIVDTQNKILNDYVERRNTNLLQSAAENNNNSAPRVSDPSLLISKDLQSLIAQRKYEQAFATALSARNIETLTWLISQLNPQEIFSQTPLPLSQYVLLSLVQQLGFDLSKDTRLKLNWLRESALVLNLKDSVISEHAPIILSKLLRNLEQHYPAFAETPNGSSFKLLMHVINSLIK